MSLRFIVWCWTHDCKVIVITVVIGCHWKFIFIFVMMWCNKGTTRIPNKMQLSSFIYRVMYSVQSSQTSNVHNCQIQIPNMSLHSSVWTLQRDQEAPISANAACLIDHNNLWRFAFFQLEKNFKGEGGAGGLCLESLCGVYIKFTISSASVVFQLIFFAVTQALSWATEALLHSVVAVRFWRQAMAVLKICMGQTEFSLAVIQ